MKFRCGRCAELKPLAEFASYPSKKRDGYCKPCRSAYSKEHYYKNRALYIRRARTRTKERVRERIEWLRAYLQGHPCVDCGESDVVVLDFDHLRDKSFDLSRGIRDMGWGAVLKEIEKCDVVCGNCHRRRTARRRNFGRYRFGRPPRQGRFLVADPE